MEEKLQEIEEELGDVFEVLERFIAPNTITFKGRLKGSSDEAFQRIREKLSRFGLIPFLREEKGGVFLKVIPIPREPKPSKPYVNLILFLTTLLTTLWAGALHQGADPIQNPSSLLLGLPFSLSLLTILGVHELGHYLMAKRHRAKATLPYFIPVPPPFLLGTLGAVIKMRSPIPTRKALIDIGAAGPLSGFVVAILAVVVGLGLSQVVSPPEKGGFGLGVSLLFLLLAQIIVGPLPQGQMVVLHPIAFAGWIGLFVTSINLLPLGQLDGGHIAYSIFGRRYPLVAKITFFILILLGLIHYYYYWLFLAAFIFFIVGLKHPPPLNDVTPLDRRRNLIGGLAFLILIMTFIPFPFGFIPPR